MLVIRVPKTLSTDSNFYKYLLARLINDVNRELLTKNYSLADKCIAKYLGTENPPICQSLLSYYIHTFTISDKGEYVSIGDNKMTEKVIGTTKTLYEVVKLIEYGVQNSPPVPALTKVIHEMTENLSELYKRWLAFK